MSPLRFTSFAVLLVLIAGPLASGAVLFSDDFEQSMSINWVKWQAIPMNAWGPQPLFNDGSHAYDGSQAARQEQAQPYWYASAHTLTSLPADKVLRLTVWQFEDFNQQGPVTNPASPRYHNHDQVQGWLTLVDDANNEFFSIGVNAHWNSPAPTLDWWTYVSWGTRSDGWHLTAVPRAQGWRNLEVRLHPYTGQVGDVEFFVNGEKVGEGSRLPGDGNGAPITRIGLGANPNLSSLDNLANTYEFFWYDQLILSSGLTADYDADGDVDLSDFAVFLGCFNGPCRAPAQPNCGDADTDADGDVDLSDFSTFLSCFNGPNRPPAAGCPR